MQCGKDNGISQSQNLDASDQPLAPAFASPDTDRGHEECDKTGVIALSDAVVQICAVMI